jgi:hypothetical protein
MTAAYFSDVWFIAIVIILKVVRLIPIVIGINRGYNKLTRIRQAQTDTLQIFTILIYIAQSKLITNL